MVYGGHFDLDSKKETISNLEKEVNDVNFWNDKKHSEEVLSKLNNLKNIVN